MSQDHDRIMGHADDNDGIEEYDNALPNWWVGLFAFSIVWGIGYAIDYHFLSHHSQAAYYDAEMALAAERWPAPAAGAVAALTPEVLAEGKVIYEQNCAACHAPDLHGKIGPNLVDAAWIHGGSLPEITATVGAGVKDKGMPTWEPILGPDRVAKVAAFVYSSKEPL
jgi:cytochrome c oxidase cbb3-type subunit III